MIGAGEVEQLLQGEAVLDVGRDVLLGDDLLVAGGDLRPADRDLVLRNERVLAELQETPVDAVGLLRACQKTDGARVGLDALATATLLGALEKL